MTGWLSHSGLLVFYTVFRLSWSGLDLSCCVTYRVNIAVLSFRCRTKAEL